MRIRLAVLAAVLAGSAASAQAANAPPPNPVTGVSSSGVRYLETPIGKKPRVIVTADPELDDNNSLIRYILHSTDYTTLGLIYTSSRFHWAGDGKGGTQDLPIGQYAGFGLCPCTHWRWGPNERFIDDVVDIYDTVYPNLKVHDKRYPAPARLRAVVRYGNIDFEGEMDHDTPGSDLIKQVLLDDVPEPVYLEAWGGQNTIARALKSIEDRYKATSEWDAVRRKVVAKAIMQVSGSQDATQDDYIRPNWPEIRYLNGGGATANLGYSSVESANVEDERYFQTPWMQQNVSGQGAMGRHVRVWQDGKAMPLGDKWDYFGFFDKSEEELRKEGYHLFTKQYPPGWFIGEGDTGAFLPLLDNGLEGYRPQNRHGPAEPKPGILGLRAPPAPGQPPAPPSYPTPVCAARPNPFLGPLMNDLAGRLAWSVTPDYKAANHYPNVTIDRTQASAKPGESVTFTARTSDPDGDAVKVEWLIFDGAGIYAGQVVMDKSMGAAGTFRVPPDAKAGDTIHLVAKATDAGQIPLTRYARAIVTVR